MALLAGFSYSPFRLFCLKEDLACLLLAQPSPCPREERRPTENGEETDGGMIAGAATPRAASMAEISFMSEPRWLVEPVSPHCGGDMVFDTDWDD